jgi:hypothetical protein
MLTIKTFKLLCLKAGTKKPIKFRTLEKALKKNIWIQNYKFDNYILCNA